jgi:hypothetical protein
MKSHRIYFISKLLKVPIVVVPLARFLEDVVTKALDSFCP